MTLENNINKFFQRELDIEKLLSKSSELKSSELADLSRELSEIKPITDLARKKELVVLEISDLEEILNDNGADEKWLIQK